MSAPEQQRVDQAPWPEADIPVALADAMTRCRCQDQKVRLQKRVLRTPRIYPGDALMGCFRLQNTPRLSGYLSTWYDHYNKVRGAAKPAVAGNVKRQKFHTLYIRSYSRR